MQQLLRPVKQYFKAALHTHSTVSDGRLTPQEVKDAYKAQGYSILCLTDHNIPANHSDMNEPDFLMLTGVEVKSGETGEVKTIPADGVFLAVGLVPENGAFESLAQLDARGYFDAGESCTTATPGIFVAGDCRRKEIRQVTTAAGDGAVAAMAACRYLDQH